MVAAPMPITTNRHRRARSSSNETDHAAEVQKSTITPLVSRNNQLTVAIIKIKHGSLFLLVNARHDSNSFTRATAFNDVADDVSWWSLTIYVHVSSNCDTPTLIGRAVKVDE